MYTHLATRAEGSALSPFCTFGSVPVMMEAPRSTGAAEAAAVESLHTASNAITRLQHHSLHPTSLQSRRLSRYAVLAIIHCQCSKVERDVRPGFEACVGIQRSSLHSPAAWQTAGCACIIPARMMPQLLTACLLGDGERLP